MVDQAMANHKSLKITLCSSNHTGKLSLQLNPIIAIIDGKLGHTNNFLLH